MSGFFFVFFFFAFHLYDEEETIQCVNRSADANVFIYMLNN